MRSPRAVSAGPRCPSDNVMPFGPAILGGAALATTIGIAIGVSRRSRAGAHL
jgi:hypothetical protein